MSNKIEFERECVNKDKEEHCIKTHQLRCYNGLVCSLQHNLEICKIKLLYIEGEFNKSIITAGDFSMPPFKNGIINWINVQERIQNYSVY